jgi:RNA recognition motif-containing protein
MDQKSVLAELFKSSQPSKFASRFLGHESAEASATLPAQAASTRPSPELSAADQLRRTVFVGNLPNKCTKADLKKLFPAKNAIVSLRFRSIQLESTNKLGRKVAVRRGAIAEEGSCNAYVVLQTPADVTAAIDKLNGTTFMGRVLRVDQATGAGGRNRVDKETTRRSVFVGHVPFDAAEEELREIFEEACGAIRHIRIPRDDKGQSRGIAYITFEEDEGVEFALKLNGATFRKQTIAIQRSNPAKGEKIKREHAGVGLLSVPEARETRRADRTTS